MNEPVPINFHSLPALSDSQIALAEKLVSVQVERERVQTNYDLNLRREIEFNRTERLEKLLVFAGAVVLSVFTLFCFYIMQKEETRRSENNQLIELVKVLKQENLLK